MKNPEQILEVMIQEMPFKFIEGTRPYILEAMRIFANEACIEQRKLCLENVLGMDANLEYMQDDILEATLAVTS
jgi:hypothetical protein